MKRIIICADVNFPKGDAGSNRVEYIGRSLIQYDYDVTIYSLGLIPLKTDENGLGVYKGIKYINLNMRKGAKRKIFSGNSMVRRICTLSQKIEAVIIYGSNALFVYPILKYCKKKGIKTIVDVVEWHQPFQYFFGAIDPRYLSNKFTFSYLAVDAHNILTLSPMIEKYYAIHNCDVLNIPIMIDKYEQVDYLPKKNRDEKYIMIYPGNPEYKDDFITMLRGISALSNDEKMKIEFHITGVSKKKLKSLLGINFDLLNINRNIFLHEWLDYESLKSLYIKCDFLYMSRYENLVTEANFPSKLPELMAYGILPLANKQGCFHLFLEDGVDSILFSNDRVDNCTDAIRRILKMDANQVEILKKNAQQKARNVFDYRNWGQQIADFVG